MGLRKVIDDTNMSRMNLESEIEALKEELIHLKKNHGNVRNFRSYRKFPNLDFITMSPKEYLTLLTGTLGTSGCPVYPWQKKFEC